MRLPKFRYAIAVGAVLGFIIPLVVTALSELHIFSVPERVVLLVWPSSIVEHRLERLLICSVLHIHLVRRVGPSSLARIVARWDNDLTNR